MNFKRKKSKRSVKCTICTANRWFGNAKGRRKPKEQAKRKAIEKEIKAILRERE